MKQQFTVGVVGLGLIGGSMARAYSSAGHIVLAHDLSEDTMQQAFAANAICARLDKTNVASCDVIYLAVYPVAAMSWLRDIAPSLANDALVVDLCGTKRSICEQGFALAGSHGFTFVGGHPMAGTQFSGFANSRANMFVGAPMVIVPPENSNEALLSRLRMLLSPVGFGSVTLSNAEEHDRIIAFTSQLAHVVSNAYVKSPHAQVHKGFSAGSYRDLTRVAWLNEHMWTELFLENRDFLGEEIDGIISALVQYRDALKDNDAERLCTLLRDGRLAKERVDRGEESK